MRAAVVTAIYGYSDELHEPVEQSVPTDFFCFMHAARVSEQETKWKIIHRPMYEKIKRTHKNGKMQAKWFKLQMHKLAMLASYDYLIWVDGSVRIKSKRFVSEMMKHTSNSICLFKHPWRDCIYQEYEQVKSKKRARGEPLEQQIKYYIDHRYPPNNGLYCGTVFGRYRSPRVDSIMNSWWDQCVRFSDRDQISLPYVLWRHKEKPNIFRGDLYNNRYFVKERHTAYYELCTREKKERP